MFEDSASGQLLARYGYLAVLAGTMLEGETIVLIAGFLAHQGYLSVPLIIVSAVIGSSISDQGLFFLARVKGMKFLERFPKARARVTGMASRMSARPVALTFFALFFRFFYGFRNIAPLFLGLSRIPTSQFVLLNALGAVLWAVSFSLGGYFFAAALSAVVGTLARYEALIVVGLLLCGGGFAFYRRWKAAHVEDGPPRAGSVHIGSGERAAGENPQPPLDTGADNP